MLSYKQFIDKHLAKYANLNRAEKEARYADYRRQYSASDNSGQSAKRGIVVAQNSPRLSRSLVPYGGRGDVRAGVGSVANSVRQNSRQRRINLPPGQVCPGLDLSPKGKEAVACCFAPFDMSTHLVGAASDAGVPTVKGRAFARGTFSAGTNGGACLMFSPVKGITTLNSVVASGSTWAGTTAFPGAAGDPGLGQLPTNGELQTTGGAVARVVGAAVRIIPQGKLIDLAGLSVSTVQPVGNDLFTVDQTDLMDEFWRSTSVHTMTDPEGGYHSAIWSPTFSPSPIGASVTDYLPSVNAGGEWFDVADTSTLGTYNLGIIISGVVPSFPFYYECYVWYEYFSTAAVSAPSSRLWQKYATPSYSDPESHALRTSSLYRTPNSLPKNKEGNVTRTATHGYVARIAKNDGSLISKIGASLKEALPGLAGNAFSIAQKFLKKKAKSVPSMLSSAMPMLPSSEGSFLESSGVSIVELLEDGSELALEAL